MSPAKRKSAPEMINVCSWCGSSRIYPRVRTEDWFCKACRRHWGNPVKRPREKGGRGKKHRIPKVKPKTRFTAVELMKMNLPAYDDEDVEEVETIEA